MWKKQTKHSDFKEIQCPEYDSIRDYKADSSGCYILIRVNRDLECIEVAIVNEKHEILCCFQGKTSQSVYHTVLEHQGENKPWLSSLEHVAYFGKELKKAELALREGSEYLQE